jgi:outer membrane protein OmpA-like peptidoglycan-associated protein
MRLKTAALLASVWLASSGAALAQVDMGNEVSVNPLPSGGGVLLYPGGRYMRVLPPLMQPGQSARDNSPIHLHMPGKHGTRVAASAPTDDVAEAPPSRPRRIRAPRAVANAAASEAPSAPTDHGGFGLGFDTPALPSAPASAPAPARPASQPARPAQIARVEPPRSAAPAPETEAEPTTPGLTKRSVILFAPQASDPAQSALGAIKFLAGDLNSAMTSASSRIQILAFGGTRGDKGSDARRLSLKRALAIRQVLIDDGVPAERIDVRAMGGADDSGPADRVDIYIKA